MHAAIKSGEAECVEVLLQHLVATQDGPSLLQRLACGPDHTGTTPLALALAATHPDMLAAILHAGLDVPALLSHTPTLLHLASPAALSVLAAAGMLHTHFTCKKNHINVLLSRSRIHLNTIVSSLSWVSSGGDLAKVAESPNTSYCCYLFILVDVLPFIFVVTPVLND